jgi:hypothetical protein
VRLELVGCVRKIRVYRFRLDVPRGPDCEKGEGVICRFNRELVEENEIEVRVQSGSVVFLGGEVFSECERPFVKEALHRPTLTFTLPWSDGTNHFPGAPSVHQGD